MTGTQIQELAPARRITPALLTMRIFLEQALDGRFTSKSWPKIIRQVTTVVAAWPDLGEIGDPSPFLERLRKLQGREDLGRELLRAFDFEWHSGVTPDELEGWTRAFALTLLYAIYGEFERLGWAQAMDLIEGLLADDLSGHSVRQYGIRKALCVLRFLEIYDDAERASCLLTLWTSRGAILRAPVLKICEGLTALRSSDPAEQLNRIPLELHIGRLAR